MFRTTAFVVIAAAMALVMIAPASADRWGADRAGQSATTTMLDARERALGEWTPATSPDWIERFAAVHSLREPVGDVRVRIDPVDAGSPLAATGGREIAWSQVAIGLGLGLALMFGLILVARLPQARPPVAR